MLNLERRCDVIQKLVLLSHCGRISNTGKENDFCSSCAALCCCCCCVPKPYSRTASWVSLTFLRHDSTSGLMEHSWLAGHPDLSVTWCHAKTPGTVTEIKALSSPYWGYRSLFVYLQAVRLQCKHHCCIIHSRRERAVPGDWQVMGQLLSLAGSWRANPGWLGDIMQFHSFP